MKKSLPQYLKVMGYHIFPIIFSLAILLGGFTKDYDLLAALSFYIVWYIAFLFKADNPSLKGLQLYVHFLIQQIPNLLQIITFAGFVAFFYKSKIEAAYFISFITALLACLYLVSLWPDYFKREGVLPKDIKKRTEQFSTYTILFFFWILLLFLLKATNILLQ